uniref:Uncharacterized protein n=1 Tax=Oryza nivara TaxID=4536 RepID=A0A0E0G4C0_ORYNI
MDVVLSSTSAALGGGRRRESGGAVGEKLAVSPGGCRLAVSLRCREVITPDGDAHASALPLPLTPPLDPRCVQLRQAPGSPGAWRRQSFVTTADSLSVTNIVSSTRFLITVFLGSVVHSSNAKDVEEKLSMSRLNLSTTNLYFL